MTQTPLAQLCAANDAINDPDELRRRLADTGYLFFRGLQNADRLRELRRDILIELMAGGWLMAGTDVDDGIANIDAQCTEGDPEYIGVYHQVQRLESFHRSGHWPEVLEMMVKVIGDGTGKVVHLGERDCSLQRNNQKVLEEAPSPALNDAVRQKIGQTVVDALSQIKYTSLGTVEFLYEDGEFYFIEMNTRLQVEHPVTEAITGIDLVREQIRIAAGAPLSFSQEDISFHGHAIECRINAEHPTTFVPSPGQVGDFHAPGGLGVRVDSGLYAGYRIPPNYDSLIAKLVVHGTTRNDCLMRLSRALEEFVIGGIDVNIPLHADVILRAEILSGTKNMLPFLRDSMMTKYCPGIGHSI